MEELPLNQIIVGDCVEVMAEWPENSLDCIVTDPPYGISFMGKEWDKALPPVTAFEQMIRVLKPGALAFVMSSPRQDVLWRMLAMLEGVGFQLRQSHISWITKTGFPKAMDVSKGIDRKFGLDREVLEPYPALKGQKYKWGKKGIYGKGKNPQNMVLTSPKSELAEKWSGWKSQTGLKPAVEMILMVNKPRSEPTIVDNVLRWGTGAINVDACRIPHQNELTGRTPYYDDDDIYNLGSKMKGSFDNKWKKGRFPANLLISDGALDTGETTKSGKFETHHKIAKDENGHSVKNVYGKYRHLPADQQVFYGDEGSSYRYFDLDVWAEHHGFLDVAKPSKAERDFGLWSFEKKELYRAGHGNQEEDDVTQRFRRQARNIHATVKPVKLMAYLIELGCPKDGVVVDPFVGSGTTCIAAKRLRRRWIGIEINPGYAEIAEARINIRGPLVQYMEAIKG